MSLILRLHDPQWVRLSTGDTADLCAHGRVELRVGETVFVRPEDGDWTVSAAGLFLLRSVQADHPLQGHESLSCNYLFPCCGFDAHIYQGRLAVSGCPNGADVAVVHDGGRVRISTAIASAEVPLEAWRAAVLSFAREVEAFYARSAPKEPAPDAETRDGWIEFWREWRELVKGLGASE